MRADSHRPARPPPDRRIPLLPGAILTATPAAFPGAWYTGDDPFDGGSERTVPVDVGDRIGEIGLVTADGAPVALADYLDRPTVIQLLRYYG